ncbi:non-canonical purine NTP diphosphatase [Aureibaculum marinum]|uniref:dITP/XTP pyrophosphatase n=1 Tax=Aureibaculum marinum TaxID=2487930 RepID=A0A3N4NQV0_9FLAO|nr:non-canonical purine NTP diphosphatase [Aureibaculum marinum]RPD98015.1 non-canonical purine NTP diphosphatase [Aureibaculum marinum]
MNIVFATHNQNKLKEVQQLVPENINLLSLDDINCNEDILETADTLLGNAQLKANYITNNYGYDCFADDTGLEVKALNNEPGVYSARYAGPSNDATANMSKLLTNLEGETDKSAQFKTVVVLNLKGEQYIFEGICKGEILNKPQGTEGFGYDPIFKPSGFDKSFAEMSLEEKGKISHRGKAIQKLVTFLKSVF